MVDHDPLVQAAAEYLRIIDYPDGDHSDLYAAERGRPDAVYLVDGDLDLARFVEVIAQAERRIIVQELIHYGDIGLESQKDGYYAAAHRVRDRIDRAKEQS